MKVKQHRKKLKRLELKREVMSHYSGYDPPRCGKCCQTDITKLTIDHAFNDGSTLRKIYPMHKRNICKWLKLNNYPVGYQVLCRKCNEEKKRDSKVYFAGDIRHPSRQELVNHIRKFNKDAIVEGDSCILNGRKILLDELFIMSFKVPDATKPLLKKIDHVSLITEDYTNRT